MYRVNLNRGGTGVLQSWSWLSRQPKFGFSLQSLTILPIVLMAASGATELHQAQQAQSLPVEDGVYLYGEVPQPDRIGVEYMVLELRQNRVVGGLYRRHSSFDCFYGQMQAQTLEMTIVPAYEDTPYSYSMVRADNAIASTAEAPVAPAFEGLYRIDRLDEVAQRVLESCRETPHSSI